MIHPRLSGALLAACGFVSASWAAPATLAPLPDPLLKGMTGAYEVRVLLEAPSETTLSSPMAGILAASPATLGQRFRQGQTLVKLVCDEREARLSMGMAELAAAQITHENKLKLQGLSQAGEIEVALAANEVTRNSAQLKLFMAQAEQCTVKAPFSGQIVKIIAKPHQGVNMGEPLLEVVESGALKIRMNAPASWLSWLKPKLGFKLEVDETGNSYNARVTSWNGRVDAVSHTIELEAELDAKAKDLLPGMSGVAHFTPPK